MGVCTGCRRIVYASSAHAVSGNVYGRASERDGVLDDADVPAPARLVGTMTVGDVARFVAEECGLPEVSPPPAQY
jgi:hypothetical protein